MIKFSELSLSPVVSSNLSRRLFVEATAIQAEAIPPALAGRDVMATAQTGTGKTLAFLLPTIEALLKKRNETGVQALILSPTRELAMQIHETFEKVAAGTGLRATIAVGGVNEQSQLRALRNGARVVIATPGRLCDFIDRKLIKLSGVRMLILDEADRMLDMGFLPSIRRILSELPASRQTLFFSATIERSVAQLIGAHLKDPVRIGVEQASKPAENINLDAYEVEQDQKVDLLSTLLNAETGSTLIFVRTKHGADRLAKNLARAGISSGTIHGGRTQNQRTQALKRFQNGDSRVLVATDVAARGIHVDGIAHVINYDLPKVADDFIHRVGRTGRAGAQGLASSFATRSERSQIGAIEKALKIRMQRRGLPDSMEQTKVVVLPVKADAHQYRSAAGRNNQRGGQRRRTAGR